MAKHLFRSLWQNRKDHVIDVYRRFLATTGIKPKYIRTLRTDQGECINHPMQALLEEHVTNYVVCAKDEQYSVGAAETAQCTSHDATWKCT